MIIEPSHTHSHKNTRAGTLEESDALHDTHNQIFSHRQHIDTLEELGEMQHLQQ